MVLNIPGLEPYTTPLPPPNLIIPLAQRFKFDMLCNMGQERSQYSASKNKEDIKSGCMMHGKGFFSPCNSGSPTPVLLLARAKDHFSPKHKGYVTCQPQGPHQEGVDS